MPNTATTSRRRSRARKTNAEPKRDPYQIVTDKIIKAIEDGAANPAKRWAKMAETGLPLRHNGLPYRGINIMLLWSTAEELGYGSPSWMTYKQAAELGGQVRKGEKGAPVVFYGSASKGDAQDADNDKPNVFRFLRTFTCFNCDQIEGLPEKFYAVPPKVIDASERKEELDAVIARTGANIVHSGKQAYYRRDTDQIRLPPFESFKSQQLYYATVFHELSHWTRHPSRLDRDLGQQRFGDEGYALEELVAELSSAFIGSELGFTPDHIDTHAAYIGHWLTALKNDKRAIFTVAAKAQAAADFVLGRYEPGQAEGEGA